MSRNIGPRPFGAEFSKALSGIVWHFDDETPVIGENALRIIDRDSGINAVFQDVRHKNNVEALCREVYWNTFCAPIEYAGDLCRMNSGFFIRFKSRSEKTGVLQ